MARKSVTEEEPKPKVTRRKVTRKKLEDLSLTELMELYSAARLICDECSIDASTYETTNGYMSSLDFPIELSYLMKERQTYNGYKNKVMNLIKKKVKEAVDE